MIASPCVNICQIDPVSGLCLGCRRSLDEIARWASMAPAERQRVMAELPGRPLPSPAKHQAHARNGGAAD